MSDEKKRLTTVRQHLRLTPFDGEPLEVHTAIPDYRVQAMTWKRHPDWPDRAEDPVTFLTFMVWAAARRTGAIALDVKWETFLEGAADVAELDPEPVDPTRPVPGTG